MVGPLDIDDDTQRMVLRKSKASAVAENYPAARDDAVQSARWAAAWSSLDRLRLHQGGHAVALLRAQARIHLAAALSRLAQ